MRHPRVRRLAFSREGYRRRRRRRRDERGGAHGGGCLRALDSRGSSSTRRCDGRRATCGSASRRALGQAGRQARRGSCSSATCRPSTAMSPGRCRCPRWSANRNDRRRACEVLREQFTAISSTLAEAFAAGERTASSLPRHRAGGLDVRGLELSRTARNALSDDVLRACRALGTAALRTVPTSCAMNRNTSDGVHRR